MINLLPQEYKKAAERETLRRFILCAGLMFLFLFLAEAIFAFVLFFWADSSLKNNRRQLELTKQLSDVKQLGQLEKKASELNNFLEFFKKTEVRYNISSDMKMILSTLPPTLKLNSISFESGVSNKLSAGAERKFILGGRAETREDLINFIDILKKNRSFNKIEFPPSSFLSAKNVDFSLTLTLI